MPGERILVVEDNEANLRLVTYVLEAKGYEIRGAGDAQQALQMVESFRPRMILMDLQLPGIDVYELTRRLKSNPATREVVIIALTAFAMRGDEDTARAAGCYGSVTKPIDTLAPLVKI